MRKLYCGGTFPFDDLENGTCPGTIADFSFASLLVPHPFSRMQNPNTTVFSCRDREEATRKIIEYLETL